METASFTGFLRTLFYIILFYYIFKFVLRLLAPYLLKKAVEKAQENFHDQTQQHYYNTDRATYGTPRQQPPRETKKVGDYIDFEELD